VQAHHIYQILIKKLKSETICTSSVAIKSNPLVIIYPQKNRNLCGHYRLLRDLRGKCWNYTSRFDLYFDIDRLSAIYLHG
jgi:hypothetical protein